MDDSEDTRIMYGAYLRHVGFHVREAATGAAALVLARREPIDVILMDIALPEMDGFEATRRLKADPDTKRIPVVALTAYAVPPAPERAAEAGCAAYLAKPCTPREVVATIERVLEGVPVPHHRETRAVRGAEPASGSDQ
ncbi:MAG TPA: response regulator [Gemmatimonadaceae bacterium]|nr:response regulator [Gemmatimonadaceae bacterium]